MSPANILILDDEPSNLHVMGAILDAEAYNVYCFNRSREALDFIEQSHIAFDLFLLDVMLPEINGFEIGTFLKQNESTKAIPILFISALHDDEEIIRGIEIGAFDFISKPFNAAILKLKVRHSIDLYQLSKHLEQRVQEEKEKNRINEALLIQQSKLAAMGQMMENIAHQWRQPLNALSIMIQQMPDDFEDKLIDGPYVDKLVQKTKEKVLFMSNTIDDFRNFFKSDKQKKSINLLELLSKVLHIFEAQFKKHSVQCTITCLSPTHEQTLHLNNMHISYGDQIKQCLKEPIALEVYVTELQQVIVNLLSNALYALNALSPHDKTIAIKVETQEAWIKLCVEDSAGGIPEELLERIFEPYFSTKGHEGTGLGLYMSKVIIEKHMNGYLNATNTQTGARFEIIFPKGCETRGGGETIGLHKRMPMTSPHPILPS